MAEVITLPATQQPPAQVLEKIEAPAGSEIDLANKFAAKRLGQILYVAEEKQWLHWNGKVWRPDKLGKVLDSIKRFVGKIGVGLDGSEGARRSFASQRSIRAIETILRTTEGIAGESEQFDADPTVLCTPGGIVDLTTGEIRPARPQDYCRKICAAKAAEAGTSLEPTFRQVLDNLTSGDEEVEKYLQKVAGYCLYGVQLDRAIFIVKGEPFSGKSTLFKTLRLVMHEYAIPARIELFLEDPRNYGNGSTNDIAELAGARLVVTGEPEAGAALSASKLKVLIGVDETRTRLNYQQGKSGATTYNIVLHCNEIPRLGRGGDAALRSRLRILPGGKTVPALQRIPQLTHAAMLRDEYPSILRWMIEGAVRLHAEGLGDLPDAAAEVRDEYFHDENPIADWLDHCVSRSDPRAFTTTAAALKSFRDFAPTSPLDEKAFIAAVRDVRWFEGSIERQFHHKRMREGGPKQMGFLGLKLGVELW